MKAAAVVYAVADEYAGQPGVASRGRRCFLSRRYVCVVVVLAGVVSVVPPVAVERDVFVLPVGLVVLVVPVLVTEGRVPVPVTVGAIVVGPPAVGEEASVISRNASEDGGEAIPVPVTENQAIQAE